MSVDYDPFGHEVMRDPWPFYTELREHSPAHYVERYDTWFLSRFEDIWHATGSDSFTAARGVTPEAVLLKKNPVPDFPAFSSLDLPRQRAYRKPLVPAYTRRAAKSMEERVRALARKTLAPLVARGAFDVHQDYADVVATTIAGELIGLPPDEAMPLRKLVDEQFAREPGQLGSSPPNQAAAQQLMARLGEIIAGRRERGENQGEDHISVWLREDFEGAPMSVQTATVNAYVMLVTGTEVVPLSVANTLFYLGERLEERRRLVKDPELIPHAFAESLRFDQPTNLLGRFVAEDLELHGQKLRAGQGVMLLWASGNRDEREFDRADVFDMDRRPRRSLSYGHGIHKCIGEHVGNLEGRVLLEELLAAAPDYEVNREGSERSYSEFLHGYRRVPVRVTPSREL